MQYRVITSQHRPSNELARVVSAPKEGATAAFGMTLSKSVPIVPADFCFKKICHLPLLIHSIGHRTALCATPIDGAIINSTDAGWVLLIKDGPGLGLFNVDDADVEVAIVVFDFKPRP